MSSYHSGRFTLKVNGSDVRVFRKKGNLVLPAGKSFTYGHLEYTVDDSDADDKSLDIDFSLVNGPLIFRESREKDCIDLKEGRKKLRDLEKEYKVPYFYIIEDRSGIVAVFSRLFGAKDRISRRFIGSSGVRVTLKGLIN